METLGIDHVGFVVADVRERAAALARALGLRANAPEDLALNGVRVLHLETGHGTIELLEPIGEQSPIAKYLREKGGGLHHVALRVRDLEAALADLKARGVPLIDERPRPGSRGHRIAFLHPKGTAGLLVELVEE
jgi:methylmalonyl-CoA/ethylmalonyl-CoA epimerase